jgi:hypothetical protein
MTVLATLAVWPVVFNSLDAALVFLPLAAVFKVIAAIISILGGHLAYAVLLCFYAGMDAGGTATTGCPPKRRGAEWKHESPDF